MADKIGTILRINEESIQTKLLSKDPQSAPDFLPDIKRHSLFQQIHREISPANSPAFGQTLTFEIPYVGDLLGECALAITLPSPQTQNAAAITEAGGTPSFLGPMWGYRNNLGYNLIQSAGLYLNGVLLDRQQGEVMCLNQGLTEKDDGRDRGLLNLVGRKSSGTVTAGTDLVASPISLLIPLQFWFCRSPRQALPIVSLNDETLELRVTLSPLANILFFNHVSPVTVDTTPTPISFIGGQYQKRDGGGSLNVDGFESGGAVTASLLSATGPTTATDFQPTRASLWLKYQFLGQEEQALQGRRVLDYPLLQVARIPDTMTEGTKIVRIPINTKNPIARIFVALEDIRVTQPLEAGGNLSEAFLQTRLGSSGGVPTGQDLTGSGSAKLLDDGQYPIERVSLLQESYRRCEMDARRLCFAEADDRGGFLWQVPGAGLIAWDEWIKNEGPTGEATMVNLQPELEIRLTDAAASQNYRIVCFLMTYNVFRIQNGGGALLFEQNG